MEQVRHSILLVDDDKMTNFYNSKIIKSMNLNWHIEVCEDGTQAMDFLTGLLSAPKADNILVPEVILLDINMPGMDGWEFIDAYAQLPDHLRAKMVIVMLTTSLNHEDQKKAAASKVVTDFYVKPLTKEKMQSIIKHLQLN